MGLIAAAFNATSGVLADQWKEYFYCDSLNTDTLLVKGQKRVGKGSSNTKGNDNVISNGSTIAVADGQCMIIVDQGKIVEVCAESGEFVWDSSSEPSIFTGKLGDSIKESFKNLGKRFTYGGMAAKDQRVYYINTKEILDNKFGTPSPFMFDVVNKQVGFRRTVQVRCNGIYTYRVTDPILFYTNVAGNVSQTYDRSSIDSTLKTEFIDALQPAFAVLTELELRPAQIPGHTKELKDAINTTLASTWAERRGITVESIALNPITLTEEDLKKINQLEDAASLGSNPFMMAGRMTDSSANALEGAANNPNGAVNAFMGMGMANNMGGFAAAQNFYNAGVQQQASQSAAAADSWKCACGATASGKFCAECGAKKPEPVQADSWKCACGATATGNFCPECGAKKPEQDAGWTCSCGAVNKGKFCQNCGAKKPEDAPLYKCDKCGWEPEDPKNPPKFCPECGDIFDDKDVK